MGLDPDRLPVVIASAQAISRQNTTALELAEQAATEAIDNVGALRDRITGISLVNVLSAMPEAPVAALSSLLGLDAPGREVTTIGGNSPQWLVTRIASKIAGGMPGAWLIVGAEALHSARSASRSDREPARSASRAGLDARHEGSDAHGDRRPPPRSPAVEIEPDEQVGDPRPGTSALETSVGLLAPVHIYSIIESSLADRFDRSAVEHREALGNMMAGFSRVASRNPFAWFREPHSPSEISTPSPSNRLVTEQCTKLMSAFLSCDMSSALIITSLGEARRLGITAEPMFIVGGIDIDDVWAVSARRDLSRSPAMSAGARTLLDACSMSIDDISAFDLYSCFPSAVEIAADAIGASLDDHRGLTTTGGLAYFGGPGSNYSTHAIATMSERLRETAGAGLVTALGWFATKHSMGLYSARPPANGFVAPDTSLLQKAIDATAVEVAPRAEGRATVLAYTVAYAHDGRPSFAPAIARLPDGRHVVARAEPDQLEHLPNADLVGREIVVSGVPPGYRVL